MDIIQTIKVRRSVREYADKPIPKEILEKIVDAGRFAPTARGVQPWEFIVVTDTEKLKKMADLAENGRFLAQGKACIAVFCNDTKYYLEDGCAATENILLMATALGVGTCWVAGDKKPYCGEISVLLNVPMAYKLVSLIALGWPKIEGSLKEKERKSLKEVLHWERF